MAGTVHGFETVGFFLTMGATFVLKMGRNYKEVVFVVLIVPGHLPQIQVVNIRRDHFFEASFVVLKSNQVDEFVVNYGSMG